MRTDALLSAVLAVGAISHGNASPLLEHELVNGLTDAAILLHERGLADAPNGYTPSQVDCPSTKPSIRLANGLSQNEQDWLKLRRANTIEPLKDLLKRLNITGLDTTNYIESNKDDLSKLPNIGISASGGGWRALLNGAGAIAAFDSRTPGATAKGHVGGVLQSATYLSGLSGGSWLVGSIYMNNFSTVDTLLNAVPDRTLSGGVWQFQRSILEGPVNGAIDTVKYFTTIFTTVQSKEDLKYNTTITDYWGRALSYQLINATYGGPDYTWSSIADTDSFKQGNTPLPLVVADGRAPGEVLISLNTTVFEFNPWEMGSYDPTLYGFAPLKYVGSPFTNGIIPENAKCVRGFDNAGYVMGTSSSLFNQLILNIDSVTMLPSLVKTGIEKVLNRLGRNEEDIADWSPNPFKNWLPGANPNAASHSLTLVDGGEDLQNIPLHPMIQPVRAVDVVFAIDSSADTLGPGPNWPNGTALVATYTRHQNTAISNGTSFPSVPDQNTFVNLGLNTRPTFFGCISQNTSTTTPLIVYLPNAPYSYHSNVSTFQPDYSKDQQYKIVANGYDVATMGNSTVDPQWPTCLGCAILSRSLDRTGTKVPSVCSQCFNRYCWNGTVASQKPTQPYQPQLILANLKSSSSGNAGGGEGGKKKGAAVETKAPIALVLWAAGVFSFFLS